MQSSIETAQTMKMAEGTEIEQKKDQNPQECPICCGKMTNPVECVFCHHICCDRCVKTYILQSPVAQCMKCNAIWNREFLYKALSKCFLNKQYKEHLEKVLFDKEISMIPATLQEVEAMIEVENIQTQIDKFERELTEKQGELRKVYEEKYNEIAEQYDVLLNPLRIAIGVARGERYETTKETAHREERKQFIRPCPTPNCNGFLSTRWKCGICGVNVCPDCFEIKEEHQEHKCKKENVESAKLIENSCKPCPSCGSMIYKIAGCFAENTPILIWGETTKMSQNIEVGDVLIGDDGKPRTVEALTTGVDKLYEITQSNGCTYRVNSKHILVLTPSNAGYEWNLDIFKMADGLLEIPVSDYMELPTKCKDLLLGLKYANLWGGTAYCPSIIKIVPVGIGNYYGWRIDGNHRFLLPDLTCVRNCSQMFCTKCHTGFDWKTGRKANGVIHNPHYYEWVRDHNNGLIPRTLGDEVCGGLPNFEEFDVSNIYLKSEFGIIQHLHRLIQHIINVVLNNRHNRRGIANVDENDNAFNKYKEQRIAYIRNHLSKEKFMIFIQRSEKALEKVRTLHEVEQMFVDTATEYLKKILIIQQQAQKSTDVHQQILPILAEIEELRKYFNKSMNTIGDIYGCVVPLIDTKFDIEGDKNKRYRRYNNEYDE